MAGRFELNTREGSRVYRDPIWIHATTHGLMISCGPEDPDARSIHFWRWTQVLSWKADRELQPRYIDDTGGRVDWGDPDAG